MNPIMSIMQMMMGGGNPQSMIKSLMGNNDIASSPMAMKAVNMLQKGNIGGIQELAQNLAKEKGTTPEQVRDSIMQQFGMK